MYNSTFSYIPGQNFYVCALSWSRDGHKLVSASTDNIVSQWDVLTGDCDQRFRFPSPILKLQYHPRDMWVRCQQPGVFSAVLSLMTPCLCLKGQGVGLSHEISPGPADSVWFQTCCLAGGWRFGPQCGCSFWQAGGVYLHWQCQGKGLSILCLSFFSMCSMGALLFIAVFIWVDL